jgi:hypothetical protein
MPADPILACQSPSNRAWPIQYLEFQREITSDNDPAGSIPNPNSPKPLSLLCEPITVRARGSVLAKFVQEWSLEDVQIGDFVTLLSLAPSEVLTIEMRRTEHTLLEQSQETASTVEVGTENLDSDKESINVANTSARTANWSVSGTGSFSLYGLGASASVTDSNTVSNSTTSTVNNIHETTVKSTKKVTTQTKLQIRGVTETTVEARQTRVLKNPFPDRVLALNLYEIAKKFTVKTYQPDLSYLRLMITATVQAIDFTQAFVSSNQAFLQDALLDTQLQSVLPTIVSALQQAQILAGPQDINNKLDALERYLFENRLGAQPFYNPSGPPTGPDEPSVNLTVAGDFEAANAAFEQGTLAFELYLTLFSYWMIMYGAKYGPDAEIAPKFTGPWPGIYPADRLQLMQGLAKRVRELWDGIGALDDSKRLQLLDQRHISEIFRRVTGFLELYDNLLGDVVRIPQPDAATVALINSLLNHLNCSADYYTEQYIRFAWNRLGSTFVICLTNDILSSLFPPPANSNYVPDTSRPYLNLYQVEDVHRNGLSILIPLQRVPDNSTIPNFIVGLNGLKKAIQDATLPAAQQAEVIVPAEGVHIEPVAGDCVLHLPSPGGS